MLRPKAIKVKPVDDYRLLVTFDNGEIGTFDVKPYIKGNWFGELEDKAIFNSVFVNGTTVEWKGGQDICPDELYYGSIKNKTKETAKVAEEIDNYNA